METHGIRKCRTLLIEHETLLRTVLARLIILSEEFILLGDIEDTSVADEICRRTQPELVIVDLDAQPTGAIAMLESIAGESPQTRLLALGDSTQTLTLQRFWSTTVFHGFIAKQESLEALEEAMIEVSTGRTYLPAWLLRQRDELKDSAASLQTLNQREREILRAVAHGSTSKAIATTLALSPRSVETYRFRIMRKLGVPNLAALIELAVRSGLAPGDGKVVLLS
jgi:two-component system invasion response regulator UvrY